MIRDFRDLVVWQKSVELFQRAVADIEGFPKKEAARIIANQIIRSIGSISANIAEGYGRHKGKEYGHYIYIARGSLNETLDWLEKLRRLGYISEEVFRDREAICLEIRAMLSKILNALDKDNNRSLIPLPSGLQGQADLY